MRGDRRPSASTPTRKERNRMPKTTRMQRQQARRMYEEDGETQAAIARHFNVSSQTVMNWKKKGEWVKAGTGKAIDDLPATTDENATESSAGPQPATTESSETVGAVVESPLFSDTPNVIQSDAALKRRIAELEAENAHLAAETERLKPTVDVSDMLEDRVAWLTENSPEGEAYWRNRAEAQFKSENRQRAKDGLPVFNISDHPDILDDLIVELKTKEEMAKHQQPTTPPSRKVKLFIMRNGMPTIEQIPMESQINNMSGSLADGIVRYTRKGFKLTEPFLCPRDGCFRPAASDELGRWAYDGYCTARHRIEVEGEEESATVGLQTKDTILSGIS